MNVPVGYGLGCSAAVALSLALALNQALKTGFSKTRVGQIAHLAEIRCRTGLGDVLASYHGGFEIRTKSGAPGIGELEKIDPGEKLDVLIICFNPISTKKFLGEKISLVNGLGGKMVQELMESKDMNEFQDKSIKFAKYIKIVTPKIPSLSTIRLGLSSPPILRYDLGFVPKTCFAPAFFSDFRIFFFLFSS